MQEKILRKNSSGFTLPELAVAIVVSTILVVGASLAISNLAVVNSRARSLSVANAVAENKFEELRSAGYISLTNGTYDFSGELPSDLSDPVRGEYTVNDYAPGLKSVEVQIEYNDQGEVKTVEFGGIIGELGVGQY